MPPPGPAIPVVDIQTSDYKQNEISIAKGSNDTNTMSYTYGKDFFTFGIYTENSDGISVYPEGTEPDGYDVLGFNVGHVINLDDTQIKFTGVTNTTTMSSIMQSDALEHIIMRQWAISTHWDAPACILRQCESNAQQHSARSTRIAVEAASLEVAMEVPIEISQVGGASTLKSARI